MLQQVQCSFELFLHVLMFMCQVSGRCQEMLNECFGGYGCIYMLVVSDRESLPVTNGQIEVFL